MNSTTQASCHRKNFAARAGYTVLGIDIAF